MHQAKKECLLANDEILNSRELDLFGDAMVGKRKADMMVGLVTVTHSEADSARLRTYNERQHMLRRDLLCAKAVETQSIFADEKTVLIRGVPGCGKTTFCHFILREWKGGQLWRDEYDFVFYINAPSLLTLQGDGPFEVAQILIACYPAVFRKISFEELNEIPYLIIMDSIDECDIELICSVIKSSSSEEAIKQLIISESF